MTHWVGPFCEKSAVHRNRSPRISSPYTILRHVSSEKRSSPSYMTPFLKVATDLIFRHALSRPSGPDAGSAVTAIETSPDRDSVIRKTTRSSPVLSTAHPRGALTEKLFIASVPSESLPA